MGFSTLYIVYRLVPLPSYSFLSPYLHVCNLPFSCYTHTTHTHTPHTHTHTHRRMVESNVIVTFPWMNRLKENQTMYNLSRCVCVCVSVCGWVCFLHPLEAEEHVRSPHIASCSHVRVVQDLVEGENKLRKYNKSQFNSH